MLENSPSGEISWLKKGQMVCLSEVKNKICCTKFFIVSKIKGVSGDYIFNYKKFEFRNENGFSLQWLKKKVRFNWYLMRQDGKFGISWPKTATKVWLQKFKI